MTDNKSAQPKLRLGMIGGGQGAFIGEVHRIAARLDGRFELVAGALSADAQKAAAGIAAAASEANAQTAANAASSSKSGTSAFTTKPPGT